MSSSTKYSTPSMSIFSTSMIFLRCPSCLRMESNVFICHVCSPTVLFKRDFIVNSTNMVSLQRLYTFSKCPNWQLCSLMHTVYLLKKHLLFVVHISQEQKSMFLTRCHRIRRCQDWRTKFPGCAGDHPYPCLDRKNKRCSQILFVWFHRKTIR